MTKLSAVTRSATAKTKLEQQTEMQHKDIEANDDVLSAINNLAVGQEVAIEYHRLDYDTDDLDIDGTAETIHGKVVSLQDGVGREYPIVELEDLIETPDGPTETVAITPVEQAAIQSYADSHDASYDGWTLGYTVELVEVSA